MRPKWLVGRGLPRLSEAGRGLGQPEARSGAERSLRKAGRPKAVPPCSRQGAPPKVVVVCEVRHHRPGRAWRGDAARRGGDPARRRQRGEPPHLVARPVELPGRGHPGRWGRGHPGRRQVGLPPERSPRHRSLVHSPFHHVGWLRPFSRPWVIARGTKNEGHLSLRCRSCSGRRRGRR
eukprot:scaffold54646_cov36-Phaeocystis_antarctica.AAC.2